VNSLGPDFDTLLIRAAVVALAAAGAWLLLVVVSVALEARSGGRVRLPGRAGCPPALRRWLLGLFLVGLSGVAAPADASTTGSGNGPAGGAGDGGSAVVAVLDGLPLPDRTSDRPAPAPAQLPRSVVVRAGDSLWRIARTALPDGAPDAAVATAVARLYAANRHVIGDDPDLIVPGQRLEIDLPTPRPATTPLREDR
jgi:LysM repeat protein